MFKTTIRAKILTYFLLVGILPIIVIFLLAVTSISGSFRETIQDNMISLVSEKATSVDELLNYARVTLGLLTEDPIITSENESIQKKLIKLKNMQNLYNVFEDIILIDLDGNVIISINYKYRDDWRKSEDFIKAKEGFVISDVHKIDYPNKNVFIVMKPVLDENNNTISVVAGQLNMEQVWMITDNVEIVKKGYMLVLDKNRKLLAGPDKSKMLQSWSDQNYPIYDTEVGIIKYYEGYSRMIGAFATPKDPDLIEKGWKLLFIQSYSDLFSIITLFIRQLLFIVALDLIVVMVVGFFLAKGISRPIMDLTNAVNTIKKGELNTQIHVKSRDEIGRLALSFNMMILELNKSKGELEDYSKNLKKKVEERTKELKSKNKELEKSRAAILNMMEDSKELIDKMKKSEEKFKAVFEGATDGILAADVKTKKFVFANPKMCEITGYPEKELLELDVSKIHPKKDLPYVLDQFIKLAEEKITITKGIPVLRKDKKVVYCDTSGKIMKIGKQNLLVGFFRNTTERKNSNTN